MFVPGSLDLIDHGLRQGLGQVDAADLGPAGLSERYDLDVAGIEHEASDAHEMRFHSAGKVTSERSRVKPGTASEWIRPEAGSASGRSEMFTCRQAITKLSTRERSNSCHENGGLKKTSENDGVLRWNPDLRGMLGLCRLPDENADMTDVPVKKRQAPILGDQCKIASPRQ